MNIIHKESLIQRLRFEQRLERSEEVATRYLEEEHSRQREQLEQSRSMELFLHIRGTTVRPLGQTEME